MKSANKWPKIMYRKLWWKGTSQNIQILNNRISHYRSHIKCHKMIKVETLGKLLIQSHLQNSIWISIDINNSLYTYDKIYTNMLVLPLGETSVPFLKYWPSTTCLLIRAPFSRMACRFWNSTTYWSSYNIKQK